METTNGVATLTKKNLPTQAELYEENLEIAFKNDQFNLLVNAEPKKEWVLTNKYAGNSKYIPIGIVETMMQRIFKKYCVEVLREGALFNSVYVTVRVHYLNLINNEWDFHDGVGAVQLQVKQGSSPSDLANINTNAVMMALPMAKSYAFKDACEHIGRLFGRDLNRKDTLEYLANDSLQPIEYGDLRELFELKKSELTPEQLKDAERILGADERTAEPKSFVKLRKQLMKL